MTNAKRTPLIHNRLDPVSQRLLVEAVLVEARRMRAEAIRDLLRRAAGFIYRTIADTAQIVRKIVQGLVRGSRNGKSFAREM
jgi:hypothetical protein